MSSDQSRHVDRMMFGIQSAMKTRHCVKAFMRAGMTAEKGVEGHYYIRVDITMAQRSVEIQTREQASPPDPYHPTFSRKGGQDSGSMVGG
jgi:hypothetical protein